MKKLLLLTFAVSLCVGASAQNKASKAPQLKRVLTNEQLKNSTPIKIEAQDPSSAPLNSITTKQFAGVTPQRVSPPSTTQIGNTFYDLQTNSAISNRFVINSDGTMSASWTTAPTADASKAYADRGTGYNYFNGTNWTIPYSATNVTPRIEGVRTGFTNVAVTTSGIELCVGHSSTQGAMNVCSRPAKGTGAWTDNGTALGAGPNTDTWAKVITGGASGENVYVICQGSGATAPPPLVFGQGGPLLYSRSTDGGATFSTLRSVIPEVDSSFYAGFGGDDYSIDANGDNIAIVVGDYNSDLVLLKSVDGGVTFTKTIIEASPMTQPYDPYLDPFPDLNSDGVSDTLQLPSGDAHVMLDNNNIAHVWYTKVLALNPDSAGTGFFPNALDGLLYWNENNPVLSVIAVTPDMNGNGQLDIPSSGTNGANGAGGYRGSLLEKPSSGIDAAGNLYVSFQTGCESCDTTVYLVLHKHIYLIGSNDGGATWSAPYDVNAGSDFSEGAFANVAKKVDANVHLIYQFDDAPGHAVSANATEAGWNQFPSDIIYATVPTNEVILGVSAPEANTFEVTSSPNPAVDFAVISVNLTKGTESVAIEITNTLGQVIFTNLSGNLAAGKHNLTINTSAFAKGVYFYTVTAGKEKVTNKMIVE